MCIFSLMCHLTGYVDYRRFLFFFRSVVLFLFVSCGGNGGGGGDDGVGVAFMKFTQLHKLRQTSIYAAIAKRFFAHHSTILH